jgi:tetrahydromethanopterin S-methyltransferase subunit G
LALNNPKTTMEAERINALAHRLEDLTQRVADLRRFL